MRPFPRPLGNDGAMPLMSSSADIFHIVNPRGATIVRDSFFVNSGAAPWPSRYTLSLSQPLLTLAQIQQAQQCVHRCPARQSLAHPAGLGWGAGSLLLIPCARPSACTCSMLFRVSKALSGTWSQAQLCCRHPHARDHRAVHSLGRDGGSLT